MNERIAIILFDLMVHQYSALHVTDDEDEMQYLRESVETGLDEFYTACHRLFGSQLDTALYNALERAREYNEHSYHAMSDPGMLDEQEHEIMLDLSDDNAAAAKLFVRLLKKCDGRYIAQANTLAKSAAYFSKRLHEKLGSSNAHPIASTDPVVNPNQRDYERDEYIYNARKHEKRSFADIGKELGITGNRVAQVYRRIDFKRNGQNADHHQPDYPHRSIRVDDAK